jgi:hypothetical protein
MTGLGGSGEPWPVGQGNEWGDDTVGWHWIYVDYYRSAGRAGGDGCRSETNQIMKINKGSQWTTYQTNRLKMGFTNTTVWSQRGDAIPVSKNY